MTTPTQPLSEITRDAIRVLVREMGVARTLQFLGQYRVGHGDYTTERGSFLDVPPLDVLFEQARKKDEERGAQPG